MADGDANPRIGITFRTYTRPDGDHPIYAAVGNIAAEWAYFEHLLDQIIFALVSDADNMTLACLTSQLTGHAPKCRVITSLLKLEGERALATSPSAPFPDGADTPEKLITKINQLQNRTFEIAERRNRVVHDPWYVEPITDQPTQWRSMPSKNPVFGLKAVEVAFLGETYEKIVDLVVDAERLYWVTVNALAAWHGKPQPPQPPSQEETARSEKIREAFLALLQSSQE
jgi:hypothetical protein